MPVQLLLRLLPPARAPLSRQLAAPRRRLAAAAAAVHVAAGGIDDDASRHDQKGEAKEEEAVSLEAACSAAVGQGRAAHIT